jgi:DNA-binding MarR family transcriptional regulator
MTVGFPRARDPTRAGPGHSTRQTGSTALDRSDLHAVVGDLERDGLVDREQDPRGSRRRAHLAERLGFRADFRNAH